MEEVNYEKLPLAIRVEDMMELLSVGRNTAYALLHSGKIRYVKIGKTYRIPKSELEAYLKREIGV